jgi:hypothetical protein
MNGLLADRAHQYRPWTATFEASLAFVFEDHILAFLGASFTGGAYLRRAVLTSKDSAHEIDLSAKKTSKTLLEVYFAVEKSISNLFLQFSLIGNESLCQIRFTHLLLYPSFPLSSASL